MRDQGLPPPRWNVSPGKVKPNKGHLVLVKLQNMGLLKFLISQNVDNLHLQSGIGPEIIAELHGNAKLMRCTQCDRQYPKEGLWDEKKWGKGYRSMDSQPNQPVCPECGGRIYSSIVNFGDPLPQKELQQSVKHSKESDVFLVVGYSLAVSPAANMPLYAKKSGAKIIIVNKQRTNRENITDIRFFEGAGESLGAILEKVQKITS